MNEAFENILDRLEEYENNDLTEHDSELCEHCKRIDCEIGMDCFICVMDKAKQIVQEVAEEYNGGWIACSERLPSGLDFVLYTHKDGEVDICSIEYFYDYLDKFTAWQPLPEPYQPKGE